MNHLELLQQDNSIAKCIIHSIYDSNLTMNRGNPAVEKLIQANIEMKQQRRGREQSKLKSKINVESLMKSCKIIEELPEIPDLATLSNDRPGAKQIQVDSDRKRMLSSTPEHQDTIQPKKSKKNLVDVKPPAENTTVPAPVISPAPKTVIASAKIIPTVPKLLGSEPTTSKFRIPAAKNSWNRQLSKPSNPKTEKQQVQKIEIQSSDEDEENDEWLGMQRSAFMSAKDKLLIDSSAKYGYPKPKTNVDRTFSKSVDRPVGKRLGARGGFVSPMSSIGKSNSNATACSTPFSHESLKGFDPQLVERIEQEIMASQQKVDWDEIAGLEHAKKSINEAVVWPLQNPKLFTGIRAPPKGLLLFGPPGTGKTLIGKCIASSVDATFFSISSSALTSKWVGEGEKLVKTLFAVARVRQPSVIFIDEIDSLLSQRSDGEQDGTRRMKTEFLVQFDGCGTDKEDRILLIGATNRPQEIDDAAQRRFRKKLYIPLPEPHGRESILKIQLSKNSNSLSEEQVADIIQKTDGYSGSDMANLISEAAMGPLRDLAGKDMRLIKDDDVRPISHQDFLSALTQVRPSVSQSDLDGYLQYEKAHGSLK